MSRVLKQVVVGLLLIGLLGAVVAIKYLSAPKINDNLGIDEAIERYGFFLQESSKKAGIDFVHQAPTLDAKLEHIMPIVNSMGASVSVVDFDHDGLLDFYVVNSGEGSKNRLYRNRGDGTFEDVTEKLGITSRRWTLAVGAADLCGTGYPDLFLANDYGVSEVYANRGGKQFVEIGKNCDIGTHPKSGMNV